MGTIELAIPKLRQGSYLPSFLNARKRSEQALLGVVMEAYTNGVSTRKVERLVEQLGVESMSKSQVSRICQALDERVEIFRNRPLEGAYTYLWLDARIERGRNSGTRAGTLLSDGGDRIRTCVGRANGFTARLL